MNKTQPILHSLSHALLVFAYTSSVAWLLFNNQKIFGQAHSFVQPLAILLLLILSATIVGTLVLSKPILLYLDGAKIEALKFFGYTVSWIFLITLTIFFFLFVSKT